MRSASAPPAPIIVLGINLFKSKYRTAMAFKGSFSFKSDTFAQTPLAPNLHLRFIRMTPAIARICCVDDNHVEINLPGGLIVNDNSNGVQIAPFQQSYFLAWSDDYSVTYNGTRVINMHNQRQWAFSGPPERQVNGLEIAVSHF